MRRAIIIETDSVDPATPVSGCGCDRCPATVADVKEIDGCALTPGDTSPVGRCPSCDGLVYINTPATRAEDALRDLLWLAKPTAGALPASDPATLTEKVEKLRAAINEALTIGFLAVEMTPVRGQWTVHFDDPDGDESIWDAMGSSPLQAVAAAWGTRRAEQLGLHNKTADTYQPDRWDFDPDDADGWDVDSIFPAGGGTDEAHALRDIVGAERFGRFELKTCLDALPVFDGERARVDGWDLVENEGTWTIQKTEGGAIPTDAAAIFHVATEAMRGSAYHAIAIALCGREVVRHE